MKNVRILIGMAIFFIAATIGLKGAVQPLEGKWTGEFKGTAGTVPFCVHFWMENDEMMGTIDFPAENLIGLKLSWIMIDSTAVHFEVVKGAQTLAFNGTLISNQLAGEFTTKSARGVFGLSRTLGTL